MKISGSEPRRIVLSALLAGTLLAAPLHAQPVDDATKNAARELAAQAADAFQKGDYARAQDLYHRAYALVPAPTLALREARALEKLGRLVEAVEAYVRTTRTGLTADSPDAYRQAVQEAHDELAKLRPRVPKLKIVVKGRDGNEELSVTLDGKSMKTALIGVEQPVNPGRHEVVATAHGKSGTADLSVAEGERKTLTVALADDPNAVPTPAEPETSTGPAPTAPTPAEPGKDEPAGSMQRTLGWVGLGVGAAGLGVGVVTGLMASSKHASAEESCPDQRCAEGSSGADDLEAFRSLRTVSTIGYAVGIVGVGAGVTLLLTAPKSSHAGVSPWIGVGSAGVAGRF